jgi:hypothetical protein
MRSASYSKYVAVTAAIRLKYCILSSLAWRSRHARIVSEGIYHPTCWRQSAKGCRRRVNDNIGKSPHAKSNYIEPNTSFAGCYQTFPIVIRAWIAKPPRVELLIFDRRDTTYPRKRCCYPAALDVHWLRSRHSVAACLFSSIKRGICAGQK